MTARREDNAVRGAVYALLGAVAGWFVMAVLVVLFVLVVPQSVGIALAAALIVGPLAVWAFRRT